MTQFSMVLTLSEHHWSLSIWITDFLL